MRRIILTAIILIAFFPVFCQENAGVTSFEIEKFDISKLFLTEFPISHEGKEFKRSEPVGYFGDNYWRFYIHFISVIQNPTNKSEYFVYGKNRLKGNISEIQGILKIVTAELYSEEQEEDVKEGRISGVYEFYEDSKKSGTGKFEGQFETFISIKDNQISYSTAYWLADGYKNNQFEGRWTSYSTKSDQICNWGDDRIPGRRGFDIGAGQMGVHPDYEKNGWENFELATFPIANSDEHRQQIEAAKKKEAEEWWK